MALVGATAVVLLSIEETVARVVAREARFSRDQSQLGWHVFALGEFVGQRRGHRLR